MFVCLFVCVLSTWDEWVGESMGGCRVMIFGLSVRTWLVVVGLFLSEGETARRVLTDCMRCDVGTRCEGFMYSSPSLLKK